MKTTIGKHYAGKHDKWYSWEVNGDFQEISVNGAKFYLTNRNYYYDFTKGRPAYTAMKSSGNVTYYAVYVEIGGILVDVRCIGVFPDEPLCENVELHSLSRLTAPESLPFTKLN